MTAARGTVVGVLIPKKSQTAFVTLLPFLVVATVLAFVRSAQSPMAQTAQQQRPPTPPLTTALEYNGMAQSACYQNGNGKLSCLSCHTMHTADPNFLLKAGMQSNEACFGSSIGA